MQKTADRRGLACAVLPDKSHDAALRHIKTDIVECEAIIALGHALNFNRIFVCGHVNPLR